MKKFGLDAILLVLMLLVFASVFTKEEENLRDSVSSEIEDFDDLVNGGNVVEDGYLDNLEGNDYDSNFISRGVLAIGNFIVDTINKGIDFTLQGIKSILD